MSQILKYLKKSCAMNPKSHPNTCYFMYKFYCRNAWRAEYSNSNIFLTQDDTFIHRVASKHFTHWPLREKIEHSLSQSGQAIYSLPKSAKRSIPCAALLSLNGSTVIIAAAELLLSNKRKNLA